MSEAVIMKTMLPPLQFSEEITIYKVIDQNEVQLLSKLSEVFNEAKRVYVNDIHMYVYVLCANIYG